MTAQRTAVWRFDGRFVSEAFKVRDAVLNVLADKRPHIDLDAARLVVTELVGNVVRHAPGTSEVLLDLDDEHPVVHVLDSGRGCRAPAVDLPIDPLAEGGRGLYIVRSLAQSLAIQNRSTGGCHMIAVL